MDTRTSEREGAGPAVLAPARPDPHRVVIIGGGFAGLYAAKNLGKAGELVDITLIDRRNHHLFQPMLYQVATGALSPGEIAQPLRSIFRRQPNTTVLLGEAIDLDAERREVRLSDGGPVPYDTLIVATGAHHAYFGHDDWAPYAPGLKTIDDATEIRRRILIAFEAAEREADPVERRAWMTFVIIGGGPTGVELAGALGEIANDTLRHDFRSINPQDARIVLVEAMDRVLATYPPGRSASARRQLEKLGVVVRLKTKVVHVEDGLVRVETPTGETEQIHTHTVLWAAGVLASSFGRTVAAATGAETDRNGRVRVGPDLTVPGHPEIFVVGDAAVQPWKKDRATPGVAQGGIQGGSYAAKAILARLRRQPVKPFRYSNHGDVAVIGRLRGVTDIPWMGPFGQQGGFTAWLLWLLIHISYLIGFANRIVVVTRWAFSFLTRGRSTRLITGQPLVPPIEAPLPVDPSTPSPEPSDDGAATPHGAHRAHGAASAADVSAKSEPKRDPAPKPAPAAERAAR
jgi:NADH:ubiquinone reductase (H+-translocating)